MKHTRDSRIFVYNTKNISTEAYPWRQKPDFGDKDVSVSSFLDEPGSPDLLNDEHSAGYDEIVPEYLGVDNQQDPERDVQHVGPVKHLEKRRNNSRFYLLIIKWEL